MSLNGSCKDNVLKYLVTQNRPYSVNDIMQNLHKEFGKPAIQKALDDLTTEKKIREKIYGKQKVYSVVQENLTQDNQEVEIELRKLDLQIEQSGEELKALEQELKQCEIILKSFESQSTTEAALKEKNELEQLVYSLSEKFERLSKSKNVIEQVEKNKVKIDSEKLEREYKKRRQICLEIVNSILENYPKDIKTLFEEIGIEADDERQKFIFKTYY